MAGIQRLFGRMVLALPHSPLDYPAVEAATELAEGLGVQCLGAFVLEPAISSLSARSGAQEFRSTVTGWEPVAHERLVQDIEDVVETARRSFVAAARRGGAADAVFQLLHGGAGEILAALIRRDDIVVMIEPRHPADRITHQFRNVAAAALAASSSVMLVPSRVLRKQGPVVAVATRPDDRAIDVAANVAGCMGEPLLIVNATGAPIARRAVPGERQPRIIASPSQSLPIERRVLADLENTGERLIVVRRTGLEQSGLRVVADRRGVPVLMLDGR
jgi:hypothetical protein